MAKALMVDVDGVLIRHRRPEGWAVEARSGFHAAEVLFIDDKQENVDAALEWGREAAVWRPGDDLVDHFPQLRDVGAGHVH